MALRAMVRACEPDVIVLGAQKAGTSALFAWLAAHPDFRPPVRKELHYFDGPDYSPTDRLAYLANFPTRIERVRHFARTGRRLRTGEATPIYLFDPRIPGRIDAALRRTKFVILLRDPAERAVSHYWMEFNRGNETERLPEALALEQARLGADLDDITGGGELTEAFRRHTYVERGRYAQQLVRWFERFDRKRFLILTYEDLCADPERTIFRVADFIGLERSAFVDTTLPEVNVGQKGHIDPATMAALRSRFTESNAELRSLVGVDYGS